VIVGGWIVFPISASADPPSASREGQQGRRRQGAGEEGTRDEGDG
jgi:hypothetical protein